MITIKETSPQDLETILTINNLAFNAQGEAESIKKLLNALFNDDTAKPLVSLIAWQNNQAIGHILFTKLSLEKSIKEISLSILAPLAVIPNYQKKGVGSLLVKEGIKFLKKQNFDLVFVLGYPEYYRRFGFQTAEKFGFFAPFPIEKKNIDAWMVLPLNNNIIGSVSGNIKCANSLNKEEYWVE